jgi:hypothetical protein
MWPVLADMAMKPWPAVLKFVAIVLAAQLPANLGLVLYILLH